MEQLNMKEYRIRCSSTMLGFFGLRTSPYKMDEILPFDTKGRQKKCGGLYWNCPYGRPIVVEMQQAFWSYLLAVILFLDGILLSSWFGLVSYTYTSDVCVYNETQVAYYMEDYKQQIGYYYAINVSNLTRSISNERYSDANATYDDDAFPWPEPFQNTEDQFSYTYGKNVSCGYYLKVCYKEKILGIPIKLCEKEWIPCEYRYVTTVNDYYFYQYQNWSKLDESIAIFTNGLNYTGTFDSDTLDFMDEAIFRINVAASAYAGWCGLLIFIGSPVVIASPKISVRIMNFLNSLRKMWFVIIFLLIWYCIELFYYFFNLLAVDTDIWLMIKYATVDPCFIDTDFIGEIYTQGDEYCEQMLNAENSFYVYQANLDYYYQIEQTYDIYDANGDNPYYGASKHYYKSLAKTNSDYDLYFNYSCSSDTILDVIAPSDSFSTFSFANLIFTSGGIAGLFLQPCLAIFFKSLFSVIVYPSCGKGVPLKPMCPFAPYANRILVPIPKEKTDDEQFEPTMSEELRDAVGKFLCVSSILPLIISGSVVFIISLNILGVSWGDWSALSTAIEDIFLGDSFTSDSSLF